MMNFYEKLKNDKSINSKFIHFKIKLNKFAIKTLVIFEIFHKS